MLLIFMRMIILSEVIANITALQKTHYTPKYIIIRKDMLLWM